MSTKTCLFCADARVRSLLDFGRQPLTNRFLATADAAEYQFHLLLGQCERCAVVQLVSPPPAEEIKSPYEWLTYNEPEGHLDDTVERLLRLPGIGTRSSFAGTSYKEDTTLARINRRGVRQTWRLDLNDLGVADSCAGLETIQAKLTPEVAAGLAAKTGQADVVICRHIFEHSQNPRSFLAAVRHLVKPDGYVVFEVPDCTRGLTRRDYSMPWEEHVAYFTPATYRLTLETQGFSVVLLEEYEYSHENSLVAICRLAGPVQLAVAPTETTTGELRRGRDYADAFPGTQAGCRDFLATFRRTQGKIAILGAGHLSAMFVNALKLADLIECVVDDNPRKQGLFMPGSRLPILPSTALIERDVKLCLLSVNPEIEDRVREKNRPFVERGGSLLSIFPGNAHPIPLVLSA